MNKLSFDGPVWLASDIHLGANNPQTAQSFFWFLDRASAQAGALLLLGDIFDVWIGDDWLTKPPPWLSECVNRLRHTSQRCPLWIGRGNRDFLMGKSLTDALGAKLLDDQFVLSVAGQPYLLAHGDEFCINDLAYQRFRRAVRNRWIQKAFLSLSLNTRAGIAQKARQQSMKSQQHTNQDTDTRLDVCEYAMAKALQTQDLHTIIHGHTHRPGHYHHQVGHQSFDRWVLPDWESDHLDNPQQARGGWLVIDQTGVTPFDRLGQKIK